jgi:hypothetical protein
MALWLRALVPLLAAGLAVLVTNLLESLTNRAWGPVLFPAVVASTWAAGWLGGIVTLAIGFTGELLLVEVPPWADPVWTATWLVIDGAVIVATAAIRKVRAEQISARRVLREQAARASQALAKRRADFLAHASDVLRSSVSYETALAGVANLAVPQVADICVVDIVNEEGQFTPLVVAHTDPGKEELVRELRRMYPLDPEAPYGPPRVLRTGQSVIYTELPNTALVETSIHPSELRVALALGISSTMAVPLLVGGRRLGVISLATTDSGRRFVPTDLPFAEDLARRVAIAVDTARP